MLCKAVSLAPVMATATRRCSGKQAPGTTPPAGGVSLPHPVNDMMLEAAKAVNLQAWHHAVVTVGLGHAKTCFKMHLSGGLG